MKRLLLALPAMIALFAGLLFGWQRGGPPCLEPWGEAIVRAAKEATVDPALLCAMVAVESGGRVDATSAKGARGLLQLMPATAAEQAKLLGLSLEDENAYVAPETNLRLGASYLARMLARYEGDEVFALAAYNAGATNVNRWRARAPELSSQDVILREGFEETRKYVVKVLDLREAYRER